MKSLNQKPIFVIVFTSLCLMYIAYAAWTDSRVDIQDERLVTHAYDLESLQGLLLPTRDTLPENYVGDIRGYGFGSNEGCFGLGIILKKMEGSHYCYRFFDATTAIGYDASDEDKLYKLHTAETLVFRANSYPEDAPIGLLDFDKDIYIASLEEAGLDYQVQEFEFGGISGVVLAYDIDAVVGGTTDTVTRNVKKLFWNDPSRLSIKWSSPAPKERSFEEIVNLLYTMRSSTGTGLSDAGYSTEIPQLVGEPIEIKSASVSTAEVIYEHSNSLVR